MFAVIETGGKQYKVSQNDVIKVEKLEATEGSTVVFEKVLTAGEGDKVQVGKPYLEKFTVSGQVLEQAKDDKVIVFKKNRRQNYRRKNGHRQQVTWVRISTIGDKVKAHPKKSDAQKEEVAAEKKATAAKKTTAKTETK